MDEASGEMKVKEAIAAVAPHRFLDDQFFGVEWIIRAIKGDLHTVVSPVNGSEVSTLTR